MESAEIPESEIVSRKIIGTSGSKKVVAVHTVGGLHLVYVGKSSKLDLKGLGSHPALARFIAKKKDPDIVYDDLTKAEDPTYFEHLVPKYEALTDQYIAIANGR